MDSSDSNITSLITTTTTSTSTVNFPKDNYSNFGKAEVVKMENSGFEVPCIICYTPVKDNSKNWKQLNVHDPDEIENDKIFQWFLLKFMVQRRNFGPKNNKKNTRKVERFDDLLKNKSIGWDGYGGQSSPLPFCGDCKTKLVELMDINTKELSGKKELEDKIQEMKKMMRNCEEKFDDCGIYDNDKRYHRVRRFILRVAMGRFGTKLKMRKANMLSNQDKLCEEEVNVKEEEDSRDRVQDWGWEEDEPEIQVKEENDLEEYEELVEGDPLGPDASAGVQLSENSDFGGNDDYHYRNCLLCYEAISKRKSDMAPVLTNNLNEQNFNSVFVLRKMLEIPKENVTSYLENFGCPGNWVEYCKNCLGLVDSALRIQKHISKLEIKLRRCQEKMRNTIKSTIFKKTVAPTAAPEDWDIKRITEESRLFVVKPVNKVVRDGEDDDGPMEPQPVWSQSDDIGPSYEEDVDLGEEKRIPSLPSNVVNLSAADEVKQKRMNKLVSILRTGSYHCQLCPSRRRTRGKMSLAKFYSHLIFHTRRPYKCSICNVYWSGPEECLTNPFAKEPQSSKGGHLCSEQTLVKVAQSDYAAGKIWACKWCPDKFEMETERNSHEDQEHSTLKSELKMKYNCLSCNLAYRSFREWLLHRALEHPEIAAISCLYCDYTAVIRTKEGIVILNGNKMSDHVNSVHSASCRKRDVCLIPETCDFCGVACGAGTDKMKRHVKNFHKLNASLSTYSCPCCWVRYDHMIQLRWHIMLEHEHGQVNVGRMEPPKQKSWNYFSTGDPDTSPNGDEMTPARKTKSCGIPKANEFEKILQDGEYTCRSCPTLVGKMSLAKFCRHVIFHKQRPYKCSVCKLYWSGEKELENNPFAKEPPSNGHLCTEATLVKFPNQGKFRRGKIWECEWCPKKFEFETTRDSHEKEMHSILKHQLEMKYNCSICKFTYRSFQEWSLHRALEHPETAAISCIYCDYTAVIQTTEGIDIPNWIQMRDHVKSFHYSGNCPQRKLFVSPEPCDFCGTLCRGGSEKLKRHVANGHKLSTGNSTYSCPCCWSRFGELGKLRKHISEKHEEKHEESVSVVELEPPEPCNPSDRLDLVDNSSSDDEDETGSGSPAKKAKLSGIEYSGDKFVKLLKGGQYTCPLCPNLKAAMPLANFHSHLIFHAKRPFKCSVCNVYWSGPGELEINPFKEQSSSKGHVCSGADLVRVPNEGKNKVGKIWDCKWCPEKFELETERDSHEDMEHSELKSQLEMNYMCLSCNSAKGFRSFWEWLLHRALDHPEVAGISCLFCDYTTVIKTKDGIDVLNTRQMKMHVNSMHPQSCKATQAFATPETCDFCGVPCKGSSDKLGRHIEIVHKLSSGESTYSCPCCWSRFGDLGKMRKHIMEQHSLTNGQKKKTKRFHVICDICGGKVLATGTGILEMVNHKLVKHNIEPEEEALRSREILSCEKSDECGGFRTLYKATMMIHMMKKHGAERIWKCEECGKGFTNSGKLARHKQIHTNKGLRPYQCEICGNSFAVKNYLYIHMRLSHQNRPFASTNKKRAKKNGN